MGTDILNHSISSKFRLIVILFFEAQNFAKNTKLAEGGKSDTFDIWWEIWLQVEDSVLLSSVLLFDLLCLTFFPRWLRSCQPNISCFNFFAICLGFTSVRYFLFSPILLSVFQPCLNWTISWGLCSIILGVFDGSMSLTVLDKNDFWMQALYWVVFYLTFFLV